MDLTNEYRLMCLNASEIQNNWEPENGDFMVEKCTYCHESGCSDEEPCNDCLKMDNVYVISGNYDYYHESSDGYSHYFYGGVVCMKCEGKTYKDDYSFIVAGNGYLRTLPEPSRYTKTQMLWLPRQDQIQNMLKKYFDCTRENIRVDFHIFDSSKPVILESWTDEMLWLAFYMKKVYKKQWNETINIKKWEKKEKI